MIFVWNCHAVEQTFGDPNSVEDLPFSKFTLDVMKQEQETYMDSVPGFGIENRDLSSYFVPTPEKEYSRILFLICKLLMI